MKKIAISILSQILPIMLGVYLGFAMNNFGENRKIRAQKVTFKNMLRNEVETNLKSIENVSTYHVDLSNSFEELLQGDDTREAFKQLQFGGFRPGFVSDSAYSTGIQTGIIQEFDLDLIQNLNMLYTLQRKYNRFTENMVNSFLANKFPETDSEIRSVMTNASMSMNDVLIFERELIANYQRVLEVI